jgi:hypothetical protein
VTAARALALASIAALTGCSDTPDTIDNGPCSLTDFCGTGAVCDFTADGGPTCIPAAGDLDGDGIPNDKDFCEHMAGGQFDEDQDGIGDDCDRCPIYPPRATPDSDNDMVDAPCDPAPTEDGDTIVLFDGFSTPGLDARWKPTTSSAWSVPGGEAIVSLAGVNAQEYLSTTVVGMNSVAIETSFRVDKIETSATQHLVGVYASDPRPAGSAKASCYSTVADADSIQRVVIETNSGFMNEIVTDAFNTANLYRAGMYVDGLTAGCSMLSNGNPLGAAQANVTPDQLANIALTARAATVRFQYVLVVGRN